MRSFIDPMMKPLDLKDCIFVCSLPLSREQFSCTLSTSKYCQRFGYWDTYNIAHNADARLSQLSRLSSLGLRGCSGAVRAQAERAFSDRPQLIILLGHCIEGMAIEFADGFVNLDEICSMIPPDFGGIIELAACDPVGFIPKAKAVAPCSRVKTFPKKLNGALYLLFYVELFLNIYQKGTYSAALVESVKTFYDAEKRGRVLLSGDGRSLPTW